MEEQLADLRKKLADAEERATEEQRRREAAEADAQQSQPMNLISYLEACHNLSLDLEVVTDASLTTQGDTTKPAGRPFPQRIIPWEDFPAQQEKIWGQLSVSDPFLSQRVYPSAHQLQYVAKYLDPISSELGLRHFARETLENPVRTLIAELYQDEKLRERLQLRGTMIFESHTNLPPPRDTSIEEEVENMSISEQHTSTTRGRKTGGKGEQGNGKGKWGKGTAHGSGRRRAGTADQFCIYEMSDGQRIPVVSIEYKPPHKLPLAQIVAGLKGEIRPAEEVINQEGDDFDFLSKSLMAAVITQLFSYMIYKGIRWGYIFAGEAIIFLNILDDPATVRYHLSIPRLDFQDDDENRLHRTAVAQIFAFFLNSLSAKTPGQAWRDKAETLETWAVEYSDILRKIPETERKEPREISYKPGRWNGFLRSPIRTRSYRTGTVCSRPTDDRGHKSSDESDDNDMPPTPTPKPVVAVRHMEQGQPAAGPRGARRTRRKKDAKSPNEIEAVSKPRIEDRPYCTQQCLRGLAYGGKMDAGCPNIQDHPGKHISPAQFRSLIRIQLATDRESGADCKTLHMKGARGALFKVRLSSYGYTLVAKGMEEVDREHLLHESRVYHHLRRLQGTRIPVSLGLVDLELPQYYDGGIYTTMLFLSWGGRSLNHSNFLGGPHIIDQATETLKALHEQNVLHTDVELRNWLFDEQNAGLMLVDFERAEIESRTPLGILSPNRKRDQRGEMKSGLIDKFTREEMNGTHSISVFFEEIA